MVSILYITYPNLQMRKYLKYMSDKSVNVIRSSEFFTITGNMTKLVIYIKQAESGKPPSHIYLECDEI